MTAALGSSSHALALLIIASDTEVTASEIGDEFAMNYECTTADTCGDAGSPGWDLTAMSFREVTDISSYSLTFFITMQNMTDDDDAVDRDLGKPMSRAGRFSLW